MRREQRLTKSRDFATVYRESRAFSSRLLVVRPKANDLARNRYGFVASRAVGKAVVRNKVRRRLKEAVRSLCLDKGWDIVIIARRTAGPADYHQLQTSLAALLRRAGIARAAEVGGVEKENREG
ncbi:MAG: ribonuclease P protein component [Dehalococcoidia bacterium]|jgi:ribonuclease P protein component